MLPDDLRADSRASLLASSPHSTTASSPPNRPSAAKTTPDPRLAEETDGSDRAVATERPHLELTATQILAGVAASVTAAILGSRLGVAGTVLGAALASGVSIAAGALYAHSIRATRHRVRRAVGRWRPDAPAASGSVDAASMLLVGSGQAPPAPARADRPPVGGSRRSAPTRVDRPARRPWWGGLAVGAVGTALVFAAALALVTGIEVVKGSPLSGGTAGGLSVLGGSRAGASIPDSQTPATNPSTTVTSTTGGAGDMPADRTIPGTGMAAGAGSTGDASASNSPGSTGAVGAPGVDGSASRGANPTDLTDPAGSAGSGGSGAGGASDTGGAAAGGTRTDAGTPTEGTGPTASTPASSAPTSAAPTGVTTTPVPTSPDPSASAGATGHSSQPGHSGSGSAAGSSAASDG